MTEGFGRSLGRYRLERLVGRGGMAEVWEARDQTLGRRVAVKIILPNLAGESRFHERFLSEARSVAALEHDHVLPIYDFGEAEGGPYLVMPFLDHGTLAERLKSVDPTPEQSIEWIRQLASALDAAHAAGVLHRDVKPANVMIGGGGRLLLADFGIAKSNQSADLTATGIALGTPAYMAPELARGEGATAASDRYALGVLAYELLCGRPPFIGDNALALLHQHLTTPVPAVVAVRPDLPEDLDPAFARILAKDPAERPPSCAALAGDIARAFGAEARGPGARAPRPTASGHRGAVTSRPDDATLAAPVVHAASTPDPSEPTAGRRTVTLAIAAVSAVLVAIALWMILRDRGSSESAETPRVADAVAPAPAGQPEVETDALPSPPSEVAAAPPSAPAPKSVTPSPPENVADSVSSSSLAPEPPAGAAGRFAVPPAEALAIFGLIADAWRKGRFPPLLFTEVERRSAPMRAAAATPGVELLTHWLEGGQALIAGDRERAREVVAEFHALDTPPEWATLLPVRFLAKPPGAPPDWQVALFWADPRNEARALVDAAAKAAPDDRNLELARAVVDHLDGDHAEAARRAVELEKHVRQGRARVVVARFAGDQLLWSGDSDAAISWYKKVVTTRDRTEIGAMLRTLSQEGGPDLVARACTAGFTPACDPQRPAQALRGGRRARPQP